MTRHFSTATLPRETNSSYSCTDIEGVGTAAAAGWGPKYAGPLPNGWPLPPKLLVLPPAVGSKLFRPLPPLLPPLVLLAGTVEKKEAKEKVLDERLINKWEIMTTAKKRRMLQRNAKWRWSQAVDQLMALVSVGETAANCVQQTREMILIKMARDFCCCCFCFVCYSVSLTHTKHPTKAKDKTSRQMILLFSQGKRVKGQSESSRRKGKCKHFVLVWETNKQNERWAAQRVHTKFIYANVPPHWLVDYQCVCALGDMVAVMVMVVVAIQLLVDTSGARRRAQSKGRKLESCHLLASVEAWCCCTATRRKKGWKEKD